MTDVQIRDALTIQEDRGDRSTDSNLLFKRLYYPVYGRETLVGECTYELLLSEKNIIYRSYQEQLDSCTKEREDEILREIIATISEMEKEYLPDHYRTQ